MKLTKPEHRAPEDADARRAIAPVVCYSPETLPSVDLLGIRQRFSRAEHVETVMVAPRDASCTDVPAGGFFRITSVEGPQVGDLNVWSADLSERFYSGKTRALHGTHLSTSDRMWSSFPTLRPLATLIEDTLDWYGFDADGGSVHDVIGTRCDPYTHALLSNGDEYHHCCHSSLTRALADYRNLPLFEAEMLVHDVLNVFMCTGFTRDTQQYFMKASPVRPGDYLTFVAETDLVVALSACPGGDCSATHSSDTAACYPLQIDVWSSDEPWQEPAVSSYSRSHGA